ncbi:MAG: DUF6249 domain-containing protein [Candidatus Zixiibacteriota bacterium]
MNSEVLIPAIIFFSIVAIVKIISDSRTKNRMLEKGLDDTNLRNFFSAQAELHSLSSIKWGMVLVGIGIAIMASQLFPRDFTDEAALGLILIFAGLGFLIYYPIAEKRLKKIKANQNIPPK